MTKKNFKSATQDIFGEYKEPKAPSEQQVNEEEKYELFLLSIKKQHLEQLKKKANDTDQEVKDVLNAILDEALKA